MSEILREISCGSSLTKAAAKHGMEPSTLSLWAIRNPEFRARYFEAFAAKMLLEADRIMEIADEVVGKQSMAEVQAVRLRYDARRWLCGKLIGELADRFDPPGVTNAVVHIHLPSKGEPMKLIEG